MKLFKTLLFFLLPFLASLCMARVNRSLERDAENSSFNHFNKHALPNQNLTHPNESNSISTYPPVLFEGFRKLVKKSVIQNNNESLPNSTYTSTNHSTTRSTKKMIYSQVKYDKNNQIIPRSTWPSTRHSTRRSTRKVVDSEKINQEKNSSRLNNHIYYPNSHQIEKRSAHSNHNLKQLNDTISISTYPPSFFERYRKRVKKSVFQNNNESLPNSTYTSTSHSTTRSTKKVENSEVIYKEENIFRLNDYDDQKAQTTNNYEPLATNQQEPKVTNNYEPNLKSNYESSTPNHHEPQTTFKHEPQTTFKHEPQTTFKHEPQTTFKHEPQTTFKHEPQTTKTTVEQTTFHPFTTQTEVTTQPTSAPHLRYNCQHKNPCWNLHIHHPPKFQFAHDKDSMFVQCSEWGSCYEMFCPTHLVWSDLASVCVGSGLRLS